MVFSKEMLVMQVRPNYSIQYQFKPTLKIERKHVRNRDVFTGFIKNVASNWKAGDYFLRCEKGSFCYFTLNGRRVKLYKKSRVTGKDYLCWQFFNGFNGKKK